MNTPPPYPDPSKPLGAWTLATYNIQDLFDAQSDFHAKDRRPTETQLRNKMTRLGRVLHILDADVIGLMEVETLGVLQRLNREALGDLGYRDVILIEGNDPERGIDVALLSRFPVTQTLSHVADTYWVADGISHRLFSRDCLECHLALPSGETLVVLVNHFKSKRGGEAETEALRTAQAARVREITEELLRQYSLIAVLGDLNDTADSHTLAPLLQDSPLTDLAALDVPEAQRYSFVHQGQTERIDYLLTSPALTVRFVRNSVLMPHDTWFKRASDHAPIRASFGAASAYPENLTVAYDRTHRPCLSRRRPARIDAARFFAHDLHPLYGQVVIVTGRVMRVEMTRGTGVVRLQLGQGDQGRAFQVTILPESQTAWARVGIADIGGYYKGQMAQAVGELHFYQGRPEIRLALPAQLKRIS
jgi:endonuclease/exonuclease/phosphatase family metal-dependent hydrolase